LNKLLVTLFLHINQLVQLQEVLIEVKMFILNSHLSNKLDNFTKIVSPKEIETLGEFKIVEPKTLNNSHILNKLKSKYNIPISKSNSNKLYNYLLFYQIKSSFIYDMVLHNYSK